MREAPAPCIRTVYSTSDVIVSNESADAEISNLIHIKNGYFGRSGNQIVPKGWGEDYLQRLQA